MEWLKSLAGDENRDPGLPFEKWKAFNWMTSLWPFWDHHQALLFLPSNSEFFYLARWISLCDYYFIHFSAVGRMYQCRVVSSRSQHGRMMMDQRESFGKALDNTSIRGSSNLGSFSCLFVRECPSSRRSF